MPVKKPLITLAKADALHTSKDAFCPEEIYYPGGKNMVYVLDIDGNPLMPTERHARCAAF